MKKMKVILLILLTLSPLNVFAYSDFIIPGGDNIGIEVKYDGVLVIGFYKIDNKYNENDIEVGDYITHVENTPISSINDLVTNIEKYQKDGYVNLTVKRKNKERIVNFKLVVQDNVYKTGLYIKDSITGIGTISYIDPETGIYGALGHEIIESTTSKVVEVKTGSIFASDVSSIDRSTNGNPGTKNAKFYYDNKYGDIKKNTIYGIYGNYTSNINKDAVSVGKPDEVKTGKAYLLTVTDSNEIKEYSIKITKIDKSSKTKNIYFEIDDPELLERTGGIVQGMSGSPIMQDGKIIGAVTHVVVENVKKGYGIFITSMLTEGERQE